MKRRISLEALMLIFGLLCGVAFIIASVVMMRVIGYDEADAMENVSDESDDSLKVKVIKTSRKEMSVADSLISLSGLFYEFETEDEQAKLPEDESDNSAKSGIIVRKTYTYDETGSIYKLPFGGLMRNDTDISRDYLLGQCLKEPELDLSVTDDPIVLIMHTHTTESYEDEAKDYYDEADESRSLEPEKTVVAVGEVIADKLTEAGIGVIHDKTIFDYPNYSGAYDRSAERVISILEENPSIEIVIDVHRDAIEQDGVRYAPVAEINGKNAAQVMIICGCLNVPRYRYNLRLASRLQSAMEESYPSLTRPLLFSERNYNQELTKGSILLEMGSSSNSLEEALYSAELVGECLKKMILELVNE